MKNLFDLVVEGLDLTSQGKFVAAEKILLQAVKAYGKVGDKSGQAFALGRLGYSYEQAGDYEKAQEVYELAVKKGTDIPAIYDSLITIFVESNQFDRAIEVAKIWQSKVDFNLSNTINGLFIKLSSRLIREKQSKEAVILLQKTIYYVPKDQYPDVYWKMQGLVGYAFEKDKNLEKAMEIYGQAIKEGSIDSSTFKRYLINLEKQEKYSLALETIEKGLNIQHDAALEVDLKKRKKRIETKIKPGSKDTSKGAILDFIIQSKVSNFSFLQQIEFRPQLKHLVTSGGYFYGITGGKIPKLFCYELGSVEKLWESKLDDIPKGLLASQDSLVTYNREGRVGEGESIVFFHDKEGRIIAKQRLPDVYSEIVADENRIYAGCRDGKLYAFSNDGKNLWTYRMPNSNGQDESVYSSPCPYYVAARKGVIAFISYETLFVLNSQGELIYKYQIQPDINTIDIVNTNSHAHSAKQDDSISLRLPSFPRYFRALYISFDGRRVIAADRDTVYQFIDCVKVKKERIKKGLINSFHYLGNDSFAICELTSADVLVYEKGCVKARIPLKSFSEITSNKYSNRIALWFEKNLLIVNYSGEIFAEIKFARNIHHVTCFDDGQILVGTRFALLFNT